VEGIPSDRNNDMVIPCEGIPSDRNNDMVIPCGRNSLRQE
jgi:hypothetical protein